MRQPHGRGAAHRRGAAQVLGWIGGSLWLYTITRNERAQRFYEGRGFVAVALGFEPIWQLDDVRYEWRCRSDDSAC